MKQDMMSYPNETMRSWVRGHVFELLAIAALAVWCVVVTVH